MELWSRFGRAVQNALHCRFLYQSGEYFNRDYKRYLGHTKIDYLIIFLLFFDVFQHNTMIKMYVRVHV